jgi:hypothetical protein
MKKKNQNLICFTLERFLKNYKQTVFSHRFLEMMQLKDWSIYPYVKGMHEGNQVTRAAECAHKFESCPFSEDQLVYYFNNYNGGFFQSFRSI